MSDKKFSRRDFFARAGHVGAALTVLGPVAGKNLFAQTELAGPADLANGVLSKTVAPPIDPSACFWAALAHARAVSRRTLSRGDRRAGPSERVLFRLVERRRLEDDRCRPRVDAGVRLAAGGVDRRDRRRAVGARHRVRRQRRVDAPRLDGLRQRDVQVDGRRSDVDAPRPRRQRSTSARSPSIRRIRTSSSSRRSANCTRQARSAASFARATAARRGQKVLYQERRCRRGRGRDRSDELERRLCRSLEYAPSALVHVRADERPGRRHLQVDRRRHDVEAADERSAEGRHRPNRNRRRARAIRVACMRSSIVCCRNPGPQQPAPAAVGGVGARRARGEAASSVRRRRRDVDASLERQRAVGTRLVLRERSRSIRRTPTSSTCRTSPCRARRTAARRGSRCAAHPAATTTIRRGSRPTIRTR